LIGIEAYFEGRAQLMARLGASGLEPLMQRAVDVTVEALRARLPVLVCGNGGSAADAEHIAAELVGRFRRDRKPYNAIALAGNSATMTAISNDYGFEHVFERQVAGHGASGGILIVLSASGNSPSVVNAARAGRELGMTVVGFSGATGGAMAALIDILFKVPSDEVALIQEGHAALYHLLCRCVEDRLAALGGS
jgi:D-sedoheptulose 7-phosphate isomerase